MRLTAFDDRALAVTSAQPMELKFVRCDGHVTRTAESQKALCVQEQHQRRLPRAAFALCWSVSLPSDREQAT